MVQSDPALKRLKLLQGISLVGPVPAPGQATNVVLVRVRLLIEGQVAGLGEGGLALARALAMTTYRSDRELDARFADDPEALVGWLEHHGRRFTERFTVESFTALSDAIDGHRVTPEAITAPTTVVGFDTDLLAPPWLVAELVQRLPRAHGVEITTAYGHDAFLKETAAVSRVLGDILCARKEVAA